MYILKGGWSQVEELCQATLIYYPRLSFDRCFSWSSFDKLVTPTGEKIRGQEALQHFENITVWDQSAKDRLAVALQTSTQSALCSAYDQDPMVCITEFLYLYDIVSEIQNLILVVCQQNTINFKIKV